METAEVKVHKIVSVLLALFIIRHKDKPSNGRKRYLPLYVFGKSLLYCKELSIKNVKHN